MRELDNVLPTRQVEGEIRQGNNKGKKRALNQSKTGNFKTPEMQDTGGEKPETPTCYN